MKHIHFIGICGAGMAAIASMMQDNGYIVTGSDDGFYDPIKTYLSTHGFDLKPGYSETNIPDTVDTIVIGKHAKLVPETNTEVAYAYKLREEKGVVILAMSELLGTVTAGRTSVVVAGSFGKSTCTAMLSWVLTQARRDPGYFIGAQVHGMNDSCRLGTGIFIFEGDEYPASNWDSHSKFEHYHPDHLLVTSLEHDHVNFFLTHADYIAPFRRLVGLLPETGTAMICAENEATDMVSNLLPHTTTSYGVDAGDWHAKHISYGMNTTFDLYHGEEYVTTLTTQMLGKHNIQNIVGVAGVALSHGWVTIPELQSGIASFVGVRRRLDRLTENSQIPLYEGFGSSYAKAKSALDAIRLHFPDSQILTIFEPHTFSWRDPKTAFWYHDVFEDATSVIVTIPPESHGKSSTGQMSPKDITESIQTNHEYVQVINDVETIYGKVADFVTTHPKPVILLLSSGELLQLPKLLPDFLSTIAL